MALQGTLETFSVPEVLRLLSGTTKTGLLALEGDRGAGKVWLRDGRIIATESDHEPRNEVEAVLFGLLRFTTGSFVFEPDVEPTEPVTHDMGVDAALTEAERLLSEWQEIESIVPSLDVFVRLVHEIEGESVVVTAEQWRSLALVGAGISVRRIGAHHDLGEFEACGLARDLVVAGLLEVADRGPEPTPYEPAEATLSIDEVANLGENLAGFVARASEDERAELDDVVDLAEPELELVPDADVVADGDGTPDASGDLDSGDLEPDDFLSQLASLSPKAAAAIEATAGEGGSEDGAASAVSAADEPMPDVEIGDGEGDEEINRNLLLKFLSSAKN